MPGPHTQIIRYSITLMTKGGLRIQKHDNGRNGLTPLESNLHKYDPVIIFQIVRIIEVENYWLQKTIESVLTNLWRMWKVGIHEQDDVSMYCTGNSKLNNKMDGVEVIDLCCESNTEIGERRKGKESPKQEIQDKMNINKIVRKKATKIIKNICLIYPLK